MPADDGALTLAPIEGREVSGRVLLGRTPAAAVAVSFLLPFEGRRSAVLPLRRDGDKLVTNIKTSESGAFHLDHLAPGTYTIEARFPNGRTESSQVIVPAVKKKQLLQLPDIRIDPGARVAVSVRDSDGMPIAHAGVGMSQQAGPAGRPRILEAHADDVGDVVLEGADLQLPVSITCSAPGFVRQNLRFAIAPATALCTLQRFATIRAVVQDEDGKPLPKARISLVGSGSAPADAEGRLVLRDVDPGEQSVRISAPGRKAWQSDVTVASGKEHDLGEVQLAAGQLVRGKVVDGESGAAIAAATVRSMLPGGASTQTDDEGAFEITDDLTAGVRVDAAGFATQSLPVTASDQPILVRLQRPGALEVTAWDGDKRCAGCLILADRSDASASGTTDGDGFVRFAELPPGDYQVTREHVGAGTGYVFVHGGEVTQFATVRPRETTRLELGKPAPPIRVSVLPAMPAGWQLTASTPTRSELLTPDSAGFFLVRKHDDETATLRLVRGNEVRQVGVIPARYTSQEFAVHVP